MFFGTSIIKIIFKNFFYFNFVKEKLFENIKHVLTYTHIFNYYILNMIFICSSLLLIVMHF